MMRHDMERFVTTIGVMFGESFILYSKQETLFQILQKLQSRGAGIGFEIAIQFSRINK